MEEFHFAAQSSAWVRSGMKGRSGAAAALARGAGRAPGATRRLSQESHACSRLQASPHATITTPSMSSIVVLAIL